MALTRGAIFIKLGRAPATRSSFTEFLGFTGFIGFVGLLGLFGLLGFVGLFGFVDFFELGVQVFDEAGVQ
jgi:hypothetical protein